MTDTATTEIYTLSLHDALPIYEQSTVIGTALDDTIKPVLRAEATAHDPIVESVIETRDVRGVLTSTEKVKTRELRSEEHTSELQSHVNLVCRLLLEKKKTTSQQTAAAAIATDYSTSATEPSKVAPTSSAGAQLPYAIREESRSYGALAPATLHGKAA